ncbi:M48 family metalloprotease [Thiohalobacter sp. IOR34]|uniref:M48 family metalloprotease n=1 Tax=Thiohalobacter sp. IOR34 TaxID=3057176 RepID=UPI0025AF121A|nr:M48 family metalloprotease [Thiohalobacter sp. IOR34]WJW76188.1 M48 family metalloprotease [Thiohalobacter sp. IOR34]
MRTPQRIRTTLAILCLATSLSVPAAPIVLPEIGDPAGATVSPEQERALGEVFMRQLRLSVAFVEDPEITSYVQALGSRLAAAGDGAAQPFTFFVVKDDAINAFAGPGGYIGIHSGLILAARNESELAAVMAHEIAHVTQRHLARAYDSASRMSLPTAAAILAAILIGTQNSEAGMAALMSAQAGSLQQQIDFTRSNEKEADHIGMQTLQQAGFDPLGMPAFFERLQQFTRYYGNRPPPFLSTHPVTSERISDALSRADQMPAAQARNSLAFHLTQAKLRVLDARDPQQLLSYFREPDRPMPAAARRYGLALAALRLGRNEQALQILSSLRKADPDRIAYRTAYSQALRQSHRDDEALAELDRLLKIYPDNLTVIRVYAEALVGTRHFRQARELLTSRLRDGETRDPSLYALLARAETGLGAVAEAHAAMAEYYYLQGQTRTAIEQLTLALKQDDLDFYQVSRVESRLRQLKQEALADQEEHGDTRHTP